MMHLWTKIRHAVLGKMWGGPVVFETRINGKFYPSHISTQDHEAIVRVVNNFIELNINMESLQFHNSSTARAIARAMMLAADALDNVAIGKSKT